VVKYINSITLSGRTLTVNNATAEDRALQWLVTKDKLGLTPNSNANKAHLRHRYALLTFAFLETSKDVFVFQRLVGWQLSATTKECDWYPESRCENGLVTNIYAGDVRGTLPPDFCWLTGLQSVSMGFSGIGGTLPTQLGWLTNLIYFSVAGGSIMGTIPPSLGAWTAIDTVNLSDNQLRGTIPSSIGAWKAINEFDISENKLSGTVPLTLAAWTALEVARFAYNNLRGAMPTFGGGFCPFLISRTTLSADCYNDTGKAEISCACCDICSFDLP
jgi:hypothetical protein